METKTKIGFIVEGDTDKSVVETVARHLLGPNFHVHAVRLGGKAALPWAYATALRLLGDKGYAHIVVVLDADVSNDDPETIERLAWQVRDQFRTHGLEDSTSICIAVPSIEAWLLSAYVEQPEAVLDPKPDLVRHLGVPALSPEVAERAARALDLTLARSRSPNFDHFARTLEGLAMQHARAPAA